MVGAWFEFECYSYSISADSEYGIHSVAYVNKCHVMTASCFSVCAQIANKFLANAFCAISLCAHMHANNMHTFLNVSLISVLFYTVLVS